MRPACALAALALALAGCGEAIPDDTMIAGRRLYMDNCSSCHRADGSGLPGTYPALDGSRIVTGPIAAHVDITLRGRRGTAMPAFHYRLSDTEIAAILTYERNAWRHTTGELVSAADVQAGRARMAASAAR